MPRKEKITTKQTVSKPVKKSYIERIEEEVTTNQSKLNLILGALIVLVVGVLLFNYFNKNKGGETQSQKVENKQEAGDVSPEKLPGKYTIKEGDTLFAVAEKYYNDGYKYTEIVKANSITNADNVEVGKILEIPKLAAAETSQLSTTPQPSPQPSVTTTVTTTNFSDTMSTDWGPKITGDKYTVVSGDWLSTIAGRAYGDIYTFDKIAKANNIANPNLIEPGMVLTIPRAGGGI